MSKPEATAPEACTEAPAAPAAAQTGAPEIQKPKKKLNLAKAEIEAKLEKLVAAAAA